MTDLGLATLAKANWIGSERQLPEFKNLPYAKEIIHGVLLCMYGKQYGMDHVLHPWTFWDGSGSDFSRDFGPEDDGDYKTGNADFYRYLSQVMDANNGQLNLPELIDHILKEASALTEASVPFDVIRPVTDDKAYSGLDRPPYNRSTTSTMTPAINRLALACMAIRLIESEQA